MADIKRDIFKRNKTIGETQQKVVFQQKKPLLNYELNLLQDISDEKVKDLAKFGIGTNYIGDAFKVVADPLANPLTVFVNKGVFYHKGFPVVLQDDVEFDNLTVALVPRTDIIYVEWFIEEVDASDDPDIKDPAIGFETTVQQRIKAEVKVAENSLPVIVPEVIVFDNSQKTISLQNGDFPDWLRIAGTRFTTSSLFNEMPTSEDYFEVVSATPKVLTVKGSSIFSDETLSYTKFYEYDDNVRQKEFVAYRKNFIQLATIARSVGTTIAPADIVDDREKNVYNYIKSGCKVNKLSSSSIEIVEGEVFVGDVNHYIESGVTYSIGSGLVDDNLNYIYVNSSGYIETSLTEPTSFHVMLAEVKVKNGDLWGRDPSLPSYGFTNLEAIEDVREFIPFAWNYKYGDEGGTGETGFTSIVLKFKADETISDRSLVYLSSSNGISKANASDTVVKRIPAIGIVPQAIPVTEINNVVILGEIENNSWNFVPGTILFAGSGGAITATPPTAQGTFVQRIGVAVTNKRIFVRPDCIYIKNNDVLPSESAIVTLNPTNGELEVMGYASKINTDRLSFLAPVATAETGSTETYFDILPGRIFVNDTESYYFDGEIVNMGIGGNFQTSGIPSNYYNKAYFTVRDDLTVQMYESISDASSSGVLDPEIPDNEMPVCMVTFRSLGHLVPGNIYNINQEDILDKRNWLNLGNLDNTSFKPVYRDDTNFLVQKGSGWFNGVYLTLASNSLVLATTSVSSTKYNIYLDISTASGTGVATGGDFYTMPATVSVDNRRYIPVGEYFSASSKITRSTFKAYSAKFWKFRDKPYVGEQTYSLTTPTSAFTVSNFSFLSEDYLDITINGRHIYEVDDYVKTPPSFVTLNYNSKKFSKLKIRKV